MNNFIKFIPTKLQFNFRNLIKVWFTKTYKFKDNIINLLLNYLNCKYNNNIKMTK